MNAVIAYINIAASGVYNMAPFLISVTKHNASICSLSKPLWLIVFLLELSFTAQATVFCLRVSSNEVIIGADSKLTIYNIFSGQTTVQKSCKITQVKDTVFIYSGSSDLGANVPIFAQQAITGTSNLSDAVERFKQLVAPTLPMFFQKLRALRPEFYKATKDGGSAIKIVFARFEDGVPKLKGLDFVPVEMPNGTIGIGFVEHQCPPCPLPITISSGLSQRAESMERTQGFWKTGTIAGIRKLIEVTMEDNHVETGPPIDILRITRTGAKWIQKKPECPETETSLKSTPKPTRSKPRR